MQQAESVTGKRAPRRIELFEYAAEPGAPSQPDWEGWEGAEESAARAPAGDAKTAAIEARLRTEFEARLAAEKQRAAESGRGQGREEGQRAEREAQAAAQAAAEKRRARQAVELIASFTEERDRYLRAVEHEVVELALAVAARILRREAQMDPLLLTGAVRVALGQLSASTQVRLRVPEAELELWTEAIALLPNLAVKPVVSAGEGMRLGDCEIESELGSVDLGIRSQLGEIERGFFDRTGSSGREAAAGPRAELAGAAAGSSRESRA